MTDFGAAWRYQADARRTAPPAQLPAAKRTRRDFEDVQQARNAYGTPRTAAGGNGVGRDVGAYNARDRAAAGYDDRTARGWREGEALQATDLLGYGAGTLSANDLGMGGGPGMGLQVGGGVAMGLNMGLDEATLMGQAGRMVGLDVAMGGRPTSVGLNGVAQESELMRANSEVLPPDASSTLFVDGLPLDCSRREAAHIFRPFIGFKEVRLVHKEAKRALGEKVVLCFVEFADARCAATALEALQGYKFDETDPDSYSLRLSFARHPGPRGPPPRDDYRRRDDDYGHRSRGRR